MQASSNTEISQSVRDGDAFHTTSPDTASASLSDSPSSRMVELDVDASQTASLEVLRTSEAGTHDLCRSGCLARRQLGALPVLTACQEDQIAVWLQIASGEALPDPSDAAQPLCGAARPRPIDRSFASPSPSTQLTNQIIPGTFWSRESSTRTQAPAAENIYTPLHQPVYGPASRQALLSTLDDNEYHTNLSSAPPLIDNDPESLQALIQPSWSERSPVPINTSNDQELPHSCLGGIGAWQAGPIPGFTDTPSPAAAGGTADDLEPRVYYPELPDL